MRVTHIIILAVALGISAGSPLDAQVIRGQVVDSSLGTPVSAGFVILKSVNGTELERTLTARDGRFTIRPPGPGLYHLRSERIGYGAWESPVIRVAPGATLDYILRVSALPIILSTITVEEDTQCQIRADQGINTSVVWEEIRKALVAASWSAAQGLFHHELHGYRRQMDRSRQRVFSEEVSLSTGFYKNPFSSLSPDSLAEHGYVVDRDKGAWRWYYAPDANVLLDETFQSTHCFTIVREESDGVPYVGLSFTPIPSRLRSDVEGTLWLNEETSSLSRLDFRYTGVENLPDDDRIGGTVEFLGTSSGAWIVNRWQIRTPQLGTRQRRDLVALRNEVVLRGFSDVGGEVVQIEGQDGSTVYTSPNVVRVVGIVYDSTSGRHLRGAQVSVEGTPYTGITSQAGVFEITALLEGEYGLTFSHAWADSLGYLPRERLATLARGDSVFVTLVVPHVNTILQERCPSSASNPDRRALVGTVRDPNGQAVSRGVGLSATWQNINMSSAGPLSVRDLGERITTDDRGRYFVCGLPLDQTITLEAETEDGAGIVHRVRFLPGIVEVARNVSNAISPYDGYAWEPRIWQLDLDVVAPPRDVLFAGVVRDITTRAPLSAVPVVVNGAPVAVSDDEGAFSVVLTFMEDETNVVSVSFPGYESLQREFTLANRQTEVQLNIFLRPAR